MVYVLLADGFEEIEALTVVDVLRRAEIAVKTVSVTGGKTGRGAHDILVAADLLCEESGTTGNVTYGTARGMPATANLAKHKPAKQLNAFAQSGKWLAAFWRLRAYWAYFPFRRGKRVNSFPGYEKFFDRRRLQRVRKGCPRGSWSIPEGPAQRLSFLWNWSKC